MENGKQVSVYHLNQDFDYLQMQDFARLDPDCLHTTLTTPLRMPEQVTTLQIRPGQAALPLTFTF